MTGKELIEGRAVLKELMGRKLPARLGLAISRNLDEMDKVAGHIEEQRIGMLERYAEKDESGNAIKDVQDGREVYRLSNENMVAFTNEYAQFLDEPIDMQIQGVPVIVLDMLDSEKFDALSGFELKALGFMIQ